MKNDFYENQLEIVRQRDELAAHQSYFNTMVDPSLNIMTDLPVEGFSPYETPQAVAEYILNRRDESEAEFQLRITTNALEKITAALRLIEKQMALALQIEPQKLDELNVCLADDQNQIAPMFRKATKAVLVARESGYIEDELQGFLIPLHESVNAHMERVLHKQINEDYLAMEREELIESIAEERLFAVELMLEANEDHLDRIDRVMHEAAYLMKAEDEGIIPHSAYPDEQIEERKQYADGALKKAGIRLQASQRYMGNIYDMGDTYPNLNQFQPVHYIVAPIRTLFDFTP